MTREKELIKVSPNTNGDKNDYYGLTPEMIQGVIAMAIKQNKMNELLDIQKNENGGENRKYYLFKRQSVKMGYIYQMKLKDPDTGVILPTKYSTGKNDLNDAIQWAEENYKSCLESYNGKAELTLLDTYYNDESPFFKYEKYEGRTLSHQTLRDRKNFMTKYITPFLQSIKIRYISQITPLLIRELKNHLSNEDLTTTTINRNLNSFKKALIVFYDSGKTAIDFSGVGFNVKASKKKAKDRGVYSIETLKGVFSKKWKTPFYKLLNMCIYLTGMRNSEILKMRLNDIQLINDVYFLSVRGTKSKNANRQIPIHPELYKELKKYVKANKINEDAEILTGLCNDTFCKACWEMGTLLGFNKKQLLEKGICYYSGRHSFKTILTTGSALNIGDVNISFAEMFMGHSFLKDELKSKKINEYNYKHMTPDVLGNFILSETGKEVFKIINHFYF